MLGECSTLTPLSSTFILKPLLGRLSQEDCEIETSLGNLLRAYFKIKGTDLGRVVQLQSP